MTAFRLPAFCLSAFLILAAPLLLAACGDDASKPGWIATVNGEGITFREAEARRILLYSRRSPEAASPSEEALQKQYRYVVSRLVEERIICQFMEKKGFDLDPARLEQEEALVRQDYPEGTFTGVLLEEGIQLDEWREAMRRRLTVEEFVNRELRPEISIATAEVEKYYKENIQDFVVAEQLHFLQISGIDREEVEKAQKNVMEKKDASATQKEYMVSIHDISAASDSLPEDVQQALDGLEPWGGSATTASADMFRNFVFIAKEPERQLDAASISKRVEQVLTEKKLRGIYAEWLNKNLSKNRIRLASALFRPVSQSQPAAGSFPVLKKPSLPEPLLEDYPAGSNAP